VEADHGRLKARLRPTRGLKQMRSARTVSTGHAFVQNLRRGHYAITTDLPSHDRVRVAFDELASCLQQYATGSTRCARTILNATAPPGLVAILR